MSTKIHNEFSARFCPHRGIGEENTLVGIEEAIRRSPFMVEFDVRPYNQTLYLGHPPHLNKHATLQDALELFKSSQVMPKIDLKLDENTFEEGLNSLCVMLSTWTSGALINVDGDLSSDRFMEAETFLMQNTVKSILLNVDLIRYQQVNSAAINQHIQSLKRLPLSLSPNLDADINDAIAFAKHHHIAHIHFWAFYNRTYELDYLCMLMERVLSNDLEVYFDIKFKNIINYLEANT